MTQPAMPSLDSLFAGGGGKSVSWKDKPIGTSVSGTIKTVHPPQQVTDLVTKEPKFKKDGTPVLQIRIDLLTSERDPEDADDDGTRSLYCRGGWMIGAIGTAVTKGGAEGAPKPGGQLTLRLIDRTPPDTPGLNPTNKFDALYVPPAAAATTDFFNQGAATNGGALPPLGAGGGGGGAAAAPVPQPSISGQGYVQPPAPPAAPAQPEPAKPDAISQAAWDTMDLSTKTATANIMANVPPF